MKKVTSLLGILIFLFGLQARAEVFVDTDGDGVPDWQDNCPNAPPGKTVWTLETVKEAKGDPSWIGCAEGEKSPAGYIPPTYESVQKKAEAEAKELTARVQAAVEAARRERSENGLTTLKENLTNSFELMAKASSKPKALIYRKAEELLQKRKDGVSVDGIASSLCGNKLVMDLILPLIEATSAQVFENAIPKAGAFAALLSQTAGSSCESLLIDHSEWSVTSTLALLQSGWSALGMVGFAQSDLKTISEMKTKLGVAMASVSGKNFKSALTDYLIWHENHKKLVESFQGHDSVAGVFLMMESAEQRLRNFLENGAEVKTGAPLIGGAGIEIGLSKTLVEAAHIPLGSSKLSCVNLGVEPYFNFVSIKPGKFMMGSPDNEAGRDPIVRNCEEGAFHAVYDPEGNENYHWHDDVNPEQLHEVTMTDDFEIQTTDVTQSLWEKVMGDNPSQYKGSVNPVENVSWDDAEAFISKLNKICEEDDHFYRLPTEAEWEYAARAGTKTAYYFGNNRSLLSQFAWWSGNSDGSTHPVATKPPNPWGLYDMEGNVFQWVEDTLPGEVGRSAGV